METYDSAWPAEKKMQWRQQMDRENSERVQKEAEQRRLELEARKSVQVETETVQKEELAEASQKMRGPKRTAWQEYLDDKEKEGEKLGNPETYAMGGESRKDEEVGK